MRNKEFFRQKRRRNRRLTDFPVDLVVCNRRFCYTVGTEAEIADEIPHGFLKNKE